MHGFKLVKLSTNIDSLLAFLGISLFFFFFFTFCGVQDVTLTTAFYNFMDQSIKYNFHINYLLFKHIVGLQGL